jgi:hypothetical protein
MASNSEKCNKEMGNLIIQKRKEKHACMQSRARNNIFILFYFFPRTALFPEIIFESERV